MFIYFICIEYNIDITYHIYIQSIHTYTYVYFNREKI